MWIKYLCRYDCSSVTGRQSVKIPVIPREFFPRRTREDNVKQARISSMNSDFISLL